jgi:UDP-N-acetylmuramoyl-L-alanine---L-glutamate ligase
MRILDGARHVAIWGFGREGRAAYEFLRRSHPDIALTILNDTPLPEPAAADVAVILGDAVGTAIRSGRFDVVVKSPGVSLYRAEISDAKAVGVRFTSATSLWFEQNPTARTIAVTGTKGKSTTARLLHFILDRAGLDVRLMGNVGTAALGQPPGRDYTIMELSSYQIADLDCAPDIAVVTNLFPEHAPWHGGTEQYFRDKLRILDIADKTKGVCNYANARLRERVASRDVVWFNRADGFCAREGRLFFDGAPVECADFPLKGEHNLGNLAAACAAANRVGVSAVRRAVDVRDFKQLDHRLQEFRVCDILCVDDSIATVPEATMAALHAYPGRDTILLLGGAERGQDFGELFAFLPRSRVRAVILLPPIGERVHAQMSGQSFPFALLRATNLKDAVEKAFLRVSENGLILLSPGAPSFGEFRDFEERGRRFRACCEEYAARASRAEAAG